MLLPTAYGQIEFFKASNLRKWRILLGGTTERVRETEASLPSLLSSPQGQVRWEFASVPISPWRERELAPRFNQNPGISSSHFQGTTEEWTSETGCLEEKFAFPAVPQILLSTTAGPRLLWVKMCSLISSAALVALRAEGYVKGNHLMDKEDVAYIHIHDGIALSREKEWDFCHLRQRGWTQRAWC